jgi:hypothetical protein
MTTTFVDGGVATRPTLAGWAPCWPLGGLRPEERKACRQRIIACQKQCALTWSTLQQTHRTIERTGIWLAASRTFDPTWSEVM